MDTLVAVPLISNDSTLYKSTRVWYEKLGAHWILFAPDKKGLPVVVDERVFSVFNSYSEGLSANESISQLQSLHPGLGAHELPLVINWLTERAFLRPQRDPGRYEASDALTYEPESFSVWLHINNHCNLDCSYCFVDKSDAEMSDEVIESSIQAIVSTVRDRKIRKFNLKFAGGEPTLSVARMELFHDKLQAEMQGVQCEWSTAVLSNGTVMSDRLIQFLGRKNVGISISVDGYGPAGQDIFRVFKGSLRGSWTIIENNITKARAHGISPYIMATISQESSKTLPDLMEWIFQQNLRARISVVRQPESKKAYSSFRASAAENTNLAQDYRALVATMIEAFEQTFDRLEKESVVLDLRNSFQICELHFDSPSFTSCCGIGSSHLVINEKGEVASCPMTLHRDTVPAATDMISSVRATFSRHSPRDRELNEGKNCLDCKWFPVCVSGCPINNLATNGRPYSVSPLNGFYEYIIPRYIRFFGTKLLQAAKRQRIDQFLALSP